MSDRDVQDYLDGLRAEPSVEDQETVALYRKVYEILDRDIPHALPTSFAQSVTDRLFAPAKAQARREPALEWILPLLGLMPLIIFAALRALPLWLERAAAAFQDAAHLATPDLRTLACLLPTIVLIGFLDGLLGKTGRAKLYG